MTLTSTKAERVWLLHHIQADDEYGDNPKLIGVYPTPDEANAAIVRLCEKPGFRDYPAGFHVEGYELNKDHWTDGFVMMLGSTVVRV